MTADGSFPESMMQAGHDELVDTSRSNKLMQPGVATVDVSDGSATLPGDISREDQESIDLARMLMAEEAMASYQQHFASMQAMATTTDHMTTEEQSIWRIAMQEEEREDAEEEEAVNELSYDGLLQLSERIGDVRSERWVLAAAKEIEKLPCFTFGSTSFKNADDSECKCLVCQCEYEVDEQLRRLPCGHYFHKMCIDTWLQEKDCCPYCRKSIID
jgi:hypothetical protein